jgi:transposase
MRALGSISVSMVRVIENLAGDWRRLDGRIDGLSGEIEAIARRDAGCERLMSVPGIGPIISSAMVAAIGNGDAFAKGRDFAAWLGLVPKQISTGDRTVRGKLVGPDSVHGSTMRVVCSGAGGITDIPWLLLLRRR